MRAPTEIFGPTPMQRKEIVFDLMNYKSTKVVDALQRYPCSISFITQEVAKQALLLFDPSLQLETVLFDPGVQRGP